MIYSLEEIFKSRTRLKNQLYAFVAILVAAFIVFLFVYSSQTDTSEEVSTLQHIEKLVLDAETGQRGYIITQDKKFLEPYINSHKTIYQLKDSFTFLDHEADLNKLFQLINEREKYFEYTIELTSSGDYQDAKAIVSRGMGKAYTDGIRAQLALIKDNVLREKAQGQTTIFIFAACLIALFLGLIFYLLEKNQSLFETIEKNSLTPINALGKTLKDFSHNNDTLITVPEHSPIEVTRLYESAIEMRHQIINQNKKLEESAKQQNKMFAIISHELRTPAAALKYLTTEQKKNAASNTNDKKIADTVDHLLGVLDDMRAATQPNFVVQSKPQMIDVQDKLATSLNIVSNIIENHDFEVIIEPPSQLIPPLFLNGQLLVQISSNLIKNAAFYSGGSQLHIVTSIIDESDKSMTLSILFSDNGTGIDEDIVDTLFDPFERGHSHKDGTGLGLHLSKQFAQEYMGGDLVLQPSSQGACFELMIKAPKYAVQTTPPSNKVLSNLDILIVEDNPTIMTATEAMLSNAGAKTQTAYNGTAALQILNTESFDLVLTDIFMPEMDGYELIKTLREQGYDKPVFGMTAAIIGNEIDELYQAGADKILTKPFTVEELNRLWLTCHSTFIE